MPTPKPNRKQLFRAALAMAGLTAGQWAEQEGFSQEHLSLVLNEKRTGSDAFLERIDSFTAEHLHNKTAALAS